MVVLAAILGIVIFGFGAVSPRGLWRVSTAWQFRNPDAVEPSDTAYAISRVGSGLMVVLCVVALVLVATDDGDDSEDAGGSSVVVGGGVDDCARIEDLFRAVVHPEQDTAPTSVIESLAKTYGVDTDVETVETGGFVLHAHADGEHLFTISADADTNEPCDE